MNRTFTFIILHVSKSINEPSCPIPHLAWPLALALVLVQHELALALTLVLVLALA